MMTAIMAFIAVPPLLPQVEARAAVDQGQFCRTASPLPMLGPEMRHDAQLEGRSIGKGARRGHASPPVPAAAPSPPPPPPSMSSYDIARDSLAGAEGKSSGADAGAASKVAGSKTVATPTEYGTRPRRPYRQPQSGILTAGEHDDLLNPELYAAYVNRSDLGQQIALLPRVDTMRVMTVTVSDRNGQPIPFADVKLSCSDGNSITMATQADGSTVFFPGLDRLSKRVTVSASRNGRMIAAARPVLVADAPGGQAVGLTADASGGAVTKLDLMLVIDTTGSMGDEIRYLQAELRSIIAAITARHRDLDIRVGFIFYRDRGDEYVTRTVPFGRDIGKAQGELARQQASGGGDYPEAMDEALIRAMGQEWRRDAVKSLLLVADAPPHDDRFGRSWAAAEVARAKRIHITPVAASGVADKAEYAMRAMAAVTQSRYLFLTDDSGVGNPHAPPSVDCYLVTRLDALVRRVIDSQISGRRVEPDRDEVIRSLGHYDAGKCILPTDFRWQNG